MPHDYNRFDSEPLRNSGPAPGGFVPLTNRIGVAGPRRMPDSLSAHSIKGRLRGQGLKQGGKDVLNDLVEELNESIRPEDDYSARSILQTLHSDLATGRQTIDFGSVKEQALEAFDRLKATLPEKKAKSPHASAGRGAQRAVRTHQRPRKRT